MRADQPYTTASFPASPTWPAWFARFQLVCHAFEKCRSFDRLGAFESAVEWMAGRPECTTGNIEPRPQLWIGPLSFTCS